VSTLERAIAIAAEAHAGQLDKADQPYILHPLRVLLRVSSESERIAAVLHDVVEDTPVTLALLAAEGFPKKS
jgi:guanosine-3',5'-bis(diphosphate) 3'-pyrophosphohydrolase